MGNRVFNLYKKLIRTGISSQTSLNLGLYLRKFYKMITEPAVYSKEKNELFFDLAKELNRIVENLEKTELFKRIDQRIEKIAQKFKGKTFTFKVRNSLLVGTANPISIEDTYGFSFSSVYGIPYIPGSSIKGACRDYAEVSGMNEGLINSIFGYINEQKNKKSYPGSVIFLDAYPVKDLKFGVEVLTPHISEDKYETPYPKEALNPVPIYFLTIAKGSIFKFTLLPMAKKQEENFEKAEFILKSQLTTFGIGAKTSLGNFGTMEEVKND